MKVYVIVQSEECGCDPPCHHGWDIILGARTNKKKAEQEAKNTYACHVEEFDTEAELK